MSVDLVIFDCDGVLIDSESLAARVHAEALGALGYPTSAAELIRRFTGVPDREMYAVIESEWGRSLPADYDERARAALSALYARDLRPIPGVGAALDGIRHPVCVASSSAPDKLRTVLRLTGLHDRFAPNIFSASQVSRGKPAPDLFLFAAERMGVAPARCLVIEDSVAGVAAAVAAGMPVLGFTGASHCGPGHGERLTQAGAGAVFDDMRRLAPLVAERGAS
ncbi:HAD family hydrolase [Salinarimonas soli]|uniref:HAD family hydrolase n=1 Tax=Salinarimonas soli TaxID=1638099 RepID=A0A5B2VFC6_9HYPH|nr:HAD family hydrolase [Salinarimonas soli]KAA2237328.1 HAD family hydrolase [Salinarimonas soli]